MTDLCAQLQPNSSNTQSITSIKKGKHLIATSNGESGVLFQNDFVVGQVCCKLELNHPIVDPWLY